MIIVPVEKKIDWRRPPLVLISLVIINILVFAFYQSGDGEILDEAVQHYYDNRMLETEWRAYQAYAQNRDLPFKVAKNDEYAIYYIVSDAAFDRFMADSGAQYVHINKRKRWRQHRDQLEEISSKISTNGYAFHVDSISVAQLFSSQFLHGGIMHLVGNMVFLVLVGFAAEAALGSAVFLLFYLISGAAGALFFAAFSSGAGSLVGASGSISGVMAMYVVLFGMRKIQFFYWVFVFTGYVRAAAIIMLPMYILKEVYSYYTIDGSNVAFTAHIGGFLAGAILVLLTKEYRSGVIDNEYLDNKPEPVDPTLQSLQRIYDYVGNCQFAQAWEMLKPIKKQYPHRADIIELEYNLVRARYPAKSSEYLIHRMDKQGNSRNVVVAQMKLWLTLEPEQRSALSEIKRSRLLASALDYQHLDVAEQVFSGLEKQGIDSANLAVMARNISLFCNASNKPAKAEEYSQLAQTMASPSYSKQTMNSAEQG